MVMLFKMDKEMLWRILGQNLLLPRRNIIFLSILNISLFLILYTMDKSLKKQNNKQLMNFKDPLQIMNNQTLHSMEKHLLIFNRQEPLEKILQLALILKPLIGEEIILSKKDLELLVLIKDGQLLMLIIGFWQKIIIVLLIKMQLHSEKILNLTLILIYILKTKCLIKVDNHGEIQMIKMQLFIQLLMEIILVMELYLLILTLMLTREKLHLYLI